MHATAKPLLDLTAGDLMTRQVLVLARGMPLRDAARLLLQHRVSGAPVVDEQGRCVGLLSAADFLRLAGKRNDVTRPAAPPLPVTCSFQVKFRGPDGDEQVLCTLPPGVCPLQGRQKGPDGKELITCTQPHCVLADWQVVEVEKLPNGEVLHYMTADPITAAPDTPIQTLARLMTEAPTHQVIVVDEQRRPVGVVSGTDLLAALARVEAPAV